MGIPTAFLPGKVWEVRRKRVLGLGSYRGVRGRVDITWSKELGEPTEVGGSYSR